MIYTVYAREDDMTFIMNEDMLAHTISVVGFYFGEPDDEATIKYTNNTVAYLED